MCAGALAEAADWAGAAPLLSCAEPLSFFALEDGALGFDWGAREVMAGDREKLFNLQYVQLAETDSSNLVAPGPIFKNRPKRLD